MKLRSALAAVLFSGSVLAADSIPVLQWDVETSRPATQKIQLYHGETISIEPRLLSYGSALTLSNVTAVVLQYRSSGMAAGTYYPLTGSVVSASSGRVRVLWTPSAEGTNSAYTFNLVTVSPSGSVYRAFGSISIAATASGSPGLVPAAAYVTPVDLASATSSLAAAISARGYGTGDVSQAYVDYQDDFSITNAASGSGMSIVKTGRVITANCVSAPGIALSDATVLKAAVLTGDLDYGVGPENIMQVTLTGITRYKIVSIEPWVLETLDGDKWFSPGNTNEIYYYSATLQIPSVPYTPTESVTVRFAYPVNYMNGSPYRILVWYKE